jgi:HK97 gp10 family phage protein
LARKTKSGRHQLNLAEELKSVLDEFSNELLQQKEIALDKASDYFVEKLIQASPIKTGELKKSWKRTDKYKNVRYVGNTAVGGKNKYGGDIPLTNLLEFSSKGKPFIRATFEQNKDKIINIIVDELNKTK